METGSDFSFVEVLVLIEVEDDKVRRDDELSRMEDLNRCCDGEEKALISIIMLATSFQRIKEQEQREQLDIQCSSLM